MKASRKLSRKKMGGIQAQAVRILIAGAFVLGGGTLWPVAAEAAENATAEAEESSAAGDNLTGFELPAVTVKGSREYDKFGNRVTEQSYYRTGGDVTVIDRQEIEEKNYRSIEEAIKRVPGVQIQGNGSHANIIGMVGAGSNYTNELSINGDTHVIIMVDGKRVGNEAMDMGGLGGGGNMVLSMLTMIDAVEKIEVMKGASASIYGADATGGAINIITRKGTDKPVTAVRLSTGSWGQHNYALSHSSTTPDGRTSFFIAASRDMSGDTEYKDASLGDSVRFKNTSYKENGVFFRVDHKFDEKQSVTFDYSHLDSIAHNPTTAPDFATIDQLWSGELYDNRPLGYLAPGYRNWFYLGSIYGSYIRYNNNRYSLQYTFDKDHGMESFVRLYCDLGRAEVMDYAGNGGLMNRPPSQFLDPEFVSNFLKGRSEIHNVMRNVGINAQYAKKVGVNNIIAAIDYRQNKYSWDNQNRDQYIDSERNFFYAWLQDKIEVSDKFVVTPTIRYSHYGTISSRYLADYLNYNSVSRTTFGLHTNYKFDDSASMYASIANVYRPITYMSYDDESIEKLDPETGMNYMIGFNKRFSDETRLDVNYSYLNMSNAIGRYPIWNEARGQSTTRSVNARQKKSAFNISIDHKIGTHWDIRASYSHVNDRFNAKNMSIDPDIRAASVDDMINSYRPSNIYQVDVTYKVGKFDATLSETVYSGLDSRYFTSSHFFILGASLNYHFDPNMKVFLTADNITNQAYETKARNFFGKGAYPQPGRSFMLGVECKF